MRQLAGTPPPPVLPPEAPVDEGPMRRELLRQIALLDGELGARGGLWANTRITPLRGPALQGGAALEQIRDELVDELHGGRRP